MKKREQFFLRLFCGILSCLMLIFTQGFYDPTKPFYIKEEEKQKMQEGQRLSEMKWVVTMVKLREGKPSFAIINGQHVELGDDVYGYQLVAIGTQSVKIKKGNQIKELWVVPPTSTGISH